MGGKGAVLGGVLGEEVGKVGEGVGEWRVTVG